MFDNRRTLYKNLKFSLDKHLILIYNVLHMKTFFDTFSIKNLQRLIGGLCIAMHRNAKRSFVGQDVECARLLIITGPFYYIKTRQISFIKKFAKIYFYCEGKNEFTKR